MKSSEKLLAYAKWLQTVQHLTRQDTPAELNIKTLWIPHGSNRSIEIDLNHEVEVIDGEVVGFNGNCGTGYTIREIPMWVTRQHIDLAIASWRETVSNGVHPQPHEIQYFVSYLDVIFTTTSK